MRILCTGFSGFIGSHLTDRFLKDGHTVIGIDRNVKWENINKDHPNLRVRQVDIFDHIPHLFWEVDVVVHMAALTRPQWSIEHPVETDLVNVNGTVKMLNHAKNNKVKRFVFVSTSNLIGNQTIYPTPEYITPHPLNTYALSKYVGELYCKLFQDVYGLEWNAIRPFNVYGKRMPITGYWTSAVATFINALKNNLPLETFGTGDQRRDFIHVDDVVDQILLLATSDVHGEVFNCGSGTNTSINELYDLICSLMGKKIEPKRNPPQFEPEGTLADISKAERLLGWKPKISLEEGLKKTI